MKENIIKTYISNFFRELEISADDSRNILKDALEQSIKEFLDDERKDTAFDVYKLFFGTYRIVLEGSNNPFMDLLDVLSAYEEKAATLIEKQRDHYIHSVNVFILGICIYIQNKNYRDIFTKVTLDEEKYSENYKTKHEEFFFRWGLASLFHDVGYPIEIIGKQVLNFLKFATDADHDEENGQIKAHLEFENFRRLNSIAEVLPKKEFIKEQYEKNESSVYIDLLQPIDLLAQKIHLALNIPIDDIKNKLDNFTEVMAKGAFIDHGFYSAIIVLKWYGYLTQVTGRAPARFYNAIVDSAGAILLHNYYRNVIEKDFTHRPLNAEEYPIAYLLMLCDELQEWNRAGYGIIEKYKTQACSANISIDDKSLTITYLAARGIFPEKFINEKKQLFEEILNINEVFSDGLKIECDTLDEIFAEASKNIDVPRPLLENMELLAIEIHNKYIQNRKLLKEDIKVDEDYYKLKPDERYSNLRQAMNMDKKLRKLGYALVSAGYDAEEVDKLPANVVEQYAIMEHEDWMQGKLRYGWEYAEERDDKNFKHNCLVPWEKLPENEKNKDRETALNIKGLARLAGMKLIKL
ncbi:MAG: hypothetical protein JXN65_01545 [Clostridia bacterium]|nr:hypothetical protein [Clostridia bacterium]